jgi:hypothetical protein
MDNDPDPATGYDLPVDQGYIEKLYPNPKDIDPAIGLKTYEDVIAHFTASSLSEDGISIVPGSLEVRRDTNNGPFNVRFRPQPGFEAMAQNFARMHVAFLGPQVAGQALNGVKACQATPAWNPMAGYPVNSSDGPSQWLLYLPLGMPMANHRAVTLLHYPPIVALRNADYLNNMTLHRWTQVLECAGVANPTLYHAIVDVNPIAAPGSGESEYPNDYFPINLTSLFFDNPEADYGYVRSLLETMLNPPWNAGNPYTLPLLIGGSPLYDPQAPGWFLVRYKDQLPQQLVKGQKNGIPRADVGQAGLVRINENSPKPTPYMIANHMIAAGVTGKCTENPSKIPDIRKYEAQDLVAATFLGIYANSPGIHPDAANQKACQRWFGSDNSFGAPNPPSAADKRILCALAQMDLCFDSKNIKPMWTYDEALERCEERSNPEFSPCFGCDPSTA